MICNFFTVVTIFESVDLVVVFSGRHQIPSMQRSQGLVRESSLRA